jgi:AraC-like DNA-binding protein
MAYTISHAGDAAIAPDQHRWYKITMPELVPMALHTRPRVRQIGVNVHGKRYMLENYRMLGHYSVHLYRYHARLLANGNWYEISPGTATVFSPTSDLSYHFNGPSEHVYAHFTFEAGAQPSVSIPLQIFPAGAFTRLDETMRQAIGWFASNPLRTEVRVWDVLWELSSLTTGAGSQQDHPALSRATEWIERHLAEPMRMATLAEHAGVSHNHLIRLFRLHKQTTILEYVRKRRVERARSLLLHTTRPIKTIAAEVGIGDLHLFNKTVRRELGKAPSELRGIAPRR